MKNILIVLMLLPITLFSQIKVTTTNYTTVHLRIDKKNNILNFNVEGIYDDNNILKKEKPKTLRLIFDNNMFIETELIDDNFSYSEETFEYNANFQINNNDKNLLETFLLKKWTLSFKYFQVTENIKTKNSKKFYYYINSKCNE